ncbi:MAG TPA: hypothetical protein VJN93_16445 [Candidatus Acidoferrum sp.]|nr:hypothetical protein [Candidatus Acidoferrum sp.]
MQLRSRFVLLGVSTVGGVFVLSALAAPQAPPAAPIPPAAPSVVAVPAAPEIPPMPSIPSMPASPAAPAAPAFDLGLAAVPPPPVPPVPPDLTSFQDDWDGHHSMNVSTGHHEPITDCSDLHIQFDDRDAVMKSEERTISQADASALHVRAYKNGGLQVYGWDKDTYSVTVCKAASSEDGDAEALLGQIHLNVSGADVSVDGPSGEHKDWAAFLLIRTPKNASIQLDATNGPLSIYSVDGKVTANAKNGPISIRNFTGEGEIHAVNGPLSIAGSAGKLTLHTQNGPISIHLEGKTWNGGGLTADAQNGPLTLFVPADYQSSFVVEASRNGPISCRASICDNARKTWDEDSRRIEYGNSPALIHLSTVNGPVSVRSAREDM